ncbi:MAG: response regulator, partial [Methanosarcinales archaeon]|nr:response regulator [Methanosarcinales archaeon]
MKIIAVDDVKQNRYLLQKLLEGHGYSVETASNGVEALEKARASTPPRPDMIITDVLMPRMDGFQLCRELKADKELKDVPVLFYSATYTDKKSQELAMSIGAAGYIVKPIEPDEFIKIIRATLEKYERGELKPIEKPLEESEYVKLHSERLIQKLEKKMLDMEREITERKRAEEKLAKIVDGVNIPAFAINSEHKITHWNTAVESLTGVKRETAVGSDKQWIALYAKKRPVMADLIVDEAPESKFKDLYGDKYKKSSLIESAYEAVDFFPALGEEGKWLLFTAAPLSGSEGTVIGAIETLQDITERKRAENALKESEEKYHNLVERANDGITIIQDNIVKYLNSRLAEMWGGTVEEVIGTPFTDYISPDERRKVVDHYKRR